MEKIKQLLKKRNIPYEILNDDTLIAYYPVTISDNFSILSKSQNRLYINGQPKSFFQWYWGEYKRNMQAKR